MLSEATASPTPPRAEEDVFDRPLNLDHRPASEMNDIVLRGMERTGWTYWIVIAILLVVGAGFFFGGWIYQIWWGLGVAGVKRPVFWGIYIMSFVFWIGISHSGTFVSAILRVFNAEFRRPITRAAEMMTTTSILVAVTLLGIDIGRPWRGYWIVPYPNQRQIWPNFHSPFLWDEMAIISYLTGSTLYLFLPLIPDLAMARERTTGWRHKIYRVLSLGWRGTESEWRHLHTAMVIFSFVIIPVMFSVHTIVSWDFAMTKVLGWRSSVFGPYFVVGAIYSGVSAVVIVLTILRSTTKLEFFIRKEHYNALGKLMLIFSFTWAYFFFNDYIVEWYGGDAIGHQVLHTFVLGQMAPFFWIMMVANIIIPWLTLWSGKVRGSPLLLSLVALSINVGMWLERYIIVTGATRVNRVPFNWSTFTPSLVESMIGIGSFGTFLLLYALLSRAVPMIPIWEVREGQMAHSLTRMGKTTLVSTTKLE